MFSYSYGSTNPSWSSRLSCQSFFNWCAYFQVDPIFFNIRKITSRLSSTVFVSSVPSCLWFSSLPCFSPRNHISQSSIILLMWSLFFLSFQCSYPVFLMKILTELQVHHSSFFSSPVVSSKALLILFTRLKCLLIPVHLLIIHLSLFICSGVLKIS